MNPEPIENRDDAADDTRVQAGLQAGQVGERLRALRKERGMSLGEVAKGSDISTSFLSLVETGRSDITLGRLMRLVHFYGIRIADILPEPPASDPRVVRSYERRRVSSPGEGIDIFLLAQDTRRDMMPIIAVFEPGGKNTEFSTHEGYEFIHVLEGALLIRFEGEDEILLREGDSAYFSAEVPHAFENIADTQTRTVEVLSPPIL